MRIMFTPAQITITSDERTNALIVRAPESVQAQIQKILEIIDRPKNTKELAVIKIKHVPATDMAMIIQNLINHRQKNDPGVCVADQKTNKIILCEESKFVKEMGAIIDAMDRKPEYRSPAFVARLKNARSDRLADLVNQIAR